MIYTIKTEDVKRLVDEKLDPRMDELYTLFSAWEQKAYEHGVDARSKFSVSSLKGKLAEEYLESRRALGRYFRVISLYKRSFAQIAAEEIGDVANMSTIIAPSFADEDGYEDGHIPLRRMILSIYHRHPDFRNPATYSFDPSAEYAQRQLFEVWLKEVEAINIRIGLKEGRRTKTLERVDFNIMEHLNEMDHFLMFDYSDDREIINPNSIPIRILGDIVTNTLFLLSEVPECAYEHFFGIATKKMTDREKRYHTIRRWDDNSE